MSPNGVRLYPPGGVVSYRVKIYFLDSSQAPKQPST